MMLPLPSTDSTNNGGIGGIARDCSVLMDDPDVAFQKYLPDNICKVG